MVIEFPPVETDLLGFVDGTDQQSDPNCQELDFRERHFDVACDNEPLIEDAVENLDETCRPSVSLTQWRRHKMAILRTFASARSLDRERGTGLSQQWRCHFSV